MEQIYQFSDWTSASKMKNRINPSLRVEVECIRSEEKLQGYALSIYDISTNYVICKFRVDVDVNDNWSLTTHQAIEVLNQIGFPCEFVDKYPKLSEEAIKYLKSLSELGYKTIYRSISSVFNQGIFVTSDTSTRGGRMVKCCALRDIDPDYDYGVYNLFSTLEDNVIYNIKDLISKES